MSDSKFMRRMRVAVIADWLLWLMVGSVFSAWLLTRLFTQWLLSVAPANLTEAELRIQQLPFHQCAACIVAFIYGVIRVNAFHPILHKRYGSWLATTPWKYPEPLPLGPIRLVWQDAVVLLILIGLALLPPWQDLLIGFYVTLAFLAGYSLSLGYALYRLDTSRALGLYALLTGFAFLAFSYPPAFALVALALIGVSHLAIGALRDFPYTEKRRKALGLAGPESPPEAPVGWKIAPLADETYLELLNPRQATIISFLAGWLVFGFATLPIEDLTVGAMLGMSFAVNVLAIGTRFFRYLGNRYPPISMAGRIATGRLLIPGYDRMFIAPLVATVAAFLLPALLLYLGVWPPLAIAVSTSITVWLALALPPSFKEWHYTGHFQIVRPTMIEPKQQRARADR